MVVAQDILAVPFDLVARRQPGAGGSITPNFANIAGVSRKLLDRGLCPCMAGVG